MAEQRLLIKVYLTSESELLATPLESSLYNKFMNLIPERHGWR